MNYIVSQILGVVVSALVFVSMQTKKMKAALLCQIGVNGLGMLSYVLLGGFAGCGIYLVAMVQAVVFCIIRHKGLQEPKWLSPVAIAAYLACSAITFRGWLDLAPMLAAVLCAIGISQKNAAHYRVAILLNGAVWVIYDVAMGAYTMLASHAITIVSALVGIIRLDILPKRKKV